MDNSFPFLSVIGISLQASAALFLAAFEVGSERLKPLRELATWFRDRMLMWIVLFPKLVEIHNSRFSNLRGLRRVSRWSEKSDELLLRTYKSKRDSLFVLMLVALASLASGILIGDELGPIYLEWAIAIVATFALLTALTTVIAGIVQVIIAGISRLEGDQHSNGTREHKYDPNAWRVWAAGLGTLFIGAILSLAGTIAGL